MLSSIFNFYNFIGESFVETKVFLDEENFQFEETILEKVIAKWFKN